MKLLSSPNSNSSPSSTTTTTTTTTSFDSKLCTYKSATASCLTGILRQILCSQSLPTHPSDHITVASHQPGVVGRLMGLDSFPNSTQNHHKHLPLLTSKLSLLEMPTSFELENEDFFVLTFDRRETSSQQTKRRRRRKGTGRSNENASEKVHLDHREDKEIANKIVLRVVNSEDSTQLTRKKNRSIEQQEDCWSQNSSPVSVLDFDQFLFHPQVAKSENCTVRRKLSSRLEDYIPLSTTHTDENCVEEDQNLKIIEETRQPSGNKYSPRSEHHFNRQGKICRIAQAQVAQWNWKFNNVEDISADFGLGILDQLLQELVESLFCLNL